MWIKFKMLVAVLVLSLFGNINSSNATLIGDTVVLEHYFNSTYQTTVPEAPSLGLVLLDFRKLKMS